LLLTSTFSVILISTLVCNVNFNFNIDPAFDSHFDLDFDSNISKSVRIVTDLLQIPKSVALCEESIVWHEI
jgi:hypothetical protein